ncbi:MAG: penicillin-binding protein 2 [Pseudomonadota bacterium]
MTERGAVVRITAETGCGVSAAEVPSDRVRAASPRGDALSGGARRIGLCMAVMSVAYLGLLARLGALAVGADPGLAAARFAEVEAQGDAGYEAAAPAAALRPRIVDRKGRDLAMNLPIERVVIDGKLVGDAARTAEALTAVLDHIDRNWLEPRIAAGRYLELRGDLSPEQADAVHRLGLPGVSFADRDRRVYPNRALAAHVLGYVDASGRGVMGLERHLNDAETEVFAASLDLRVQRVVEAELDAAITEFEAKAGWAIVMDAATGELVAVASAPDFDPNLSGDPEDPDRLNRAFSGTYELGSAFKTLTAAAAIEAGVAGEETLIDARKPIVVGGWPVRDLHPEERFLSVEEVVAHSSNIGSAQLALSLGPEGVRGFLARFGMFEEIEIEAAETARPQAPRKWGPSELATVSYGHGIAVTPLHLVKAYAELLNGGCRVAPTLKKRKGETDCEQIISPRTSVAARRILRAVTGYGTGKNARAEGFHVIGKTSTADKPASGGYDRGKRLSSFVGAFPGYDPQYVILVSLDEPKPQAHTHGFATAGWTAAPAFSRIVARIAPVLGVAEADEFEIAAGYMGLGLVDGYAGFVSAEASR